MTFDVERLTAELDCVNPQRWTEADLADLRNVPADDRAEELAYARDWFPVLRDFFRRVRQGGSILVHERIY